MKKLIFIFIPFYSLFANNQAPLNEVQSLIDTKNKKIFILEKKDLKEVLIEKKPLPVVMSNNLENKNAVVSNEPIKEIIMSSNNENTKNISMNEKSSELSSSQIVSVNPITTISNYNEYINSLNSNEKKNITMNFSDLIKATKYIFDNNLENKYSSELKPKLLEEAKKIGNIDMLFLEEALNNMNKQTINELVSNLGEI